MSKRVLKLSENQLKLKTAKFKVFDKTIYRLQESYDVNHQKLSRARAHQGRRDKTSAVNKIT